MSDLQAISGQPILNIPPFTWAEYSRLEWYSWGEGCDFYVVFVFQAWHWSIHRMINPGDPIIHDRSVTENAGYATAVDAMNACHNYYRRERIS